MTVTLEEVNVRLHRLRRLYHHVVHGGSLSGLTYSDGKPMPATKKDLSQAIVDLEERQMRLMEKGDGR